jgi:malonyl-CoA O-methyltransferase
MELEQSALSQLLPILSGRRVIDLACGSGRYGELAQRQGASAVYGVDHSPEMLSRARFPVCQGELDALPFPSGWGEVAICGLALGHLPPTRLEAAFREIGRILSVGGVLAVSDFHPYQAQRGAARTFTVNGRLYAVEHYAHSLESYRSALNQAGFYLEAVQEVTPPETNGTPAILVWRAIRRV